MISAIEPVTKKKDNSSVKSAANSSGKGHGIWGLSPGQIHDAWWRGQGLQAVHASCPVELDTSAEAYLLLPGDRLVTFDLEEIVSNLVWSQASETDLLITERDEDRYREEIIRDESGGLVGISRSYNALDTMSIKATVTTDVDLAASWAKGEPVDSEGRSEPVRELEVAGHIYVATIDEDQRSFLAWIVAQWPDPHRVIDGIHEISPGVIARRTRPELDGCILVPPLWLGFEERFEENQLLVGPDFVLDGTASDDVEPLPRVLPVRDIPIAGGRRVKRLIPRRTFYGVAKRTFDFVMAVAAIIVLSPVFLIAAVAIVADNGFPIFFGHVRQQRGGKNFKCWKFRTMRRDAESMVLQLSEMNKADGPQVFIENDPRVTRIGRFLRASQIDELPQFWNVVRGQMSFVGPRPSPDRENQYCPAWRELRLSVRPGITGLWQVSRTRNPGEDFQEWIKFDIRYVRSASIMLDLQILLKTVKQTVMR